MRFPRMHIAESVTNRILNVARQTEPRETVTGPVPPLPDVAQQGADIDAALRQPGVAAAPPAGSEPLMTDAALQGDSALDMATSTQLVG